MSQEVPQASAIKGGERVASADGTAFTTDPTLAQYIRTTGTLTATAVNTAGDYLSKGIVQAGEWYRCFAVPVRVSVDVFCAAHDCALGISLVNSYSGVNRSLPCCVLLH